jgi:hypothetical protein
VIYCRKAAGAGKTLRRVAAPAAATTLENVSEYPFARMDELSVRRAGVSISLTTTLLRLRGKPMPVFCRVAASERTIFWVFEGAVTDKELFDAHETLWADPEYRPEYSRLVDTTGSNPVRLSAEAVRWIADRNTRARIGKIAFVASADAMYGMSRMYELYSEGVPCRVFRSRSEALGWLGLAEMRARSAATAD